MVILMKQLFLDFREMKHYFIASSMVFLAGIYLGFASDDFHAYLYSQVEGIRKLSEKINATDHPQLGYFIFIFINNALKSILFVFLGALFGVLPLFVLLVNGMILGFVFATSASPDSLLELFVKGILPHGIIEIPAVIIACAYGIRFGVLMMKGTFRFLHPSSRTKATGEIVSFLKMTPPLMLLLVAALFAAALIESTLTYMLMKP